MAGKLRKRLVRALTPGLRDRGFAPARSPYFVRPRPAWQDVVWPDALESSQATFTVAYGIHVSHVAEVLVAAGLPDSPAPEVARQLGGQRFYTPPPPQDPEVLVPTVLRDFDSEAEPWFGRFRDLANVAEYYRQHELGGTEFNDRAKVVYALLLEASRQLEDADRWFRRAADALSRPTYAVGQRFFREAVAGGIEVRPNPFDQRLLQLVKRRIGEVEGDA